MDNSAVCSAAKMVDGIPKVVETHPGQRNALSKTLLFHFSPPNTSTKTWTETT